MNTPGPPPPPHDSPYEPPDSSLGGDPHPDSGIIQSQVDGPAIALMVTAGIGLLLQLLGLVLNTMGIGLMGLQEELQSLDQEEMFINMFSGALGIVSALVGIVIALFIFYGAAKMRKLESWGLSLSAAIVAMIPCVSPCCILGLPIGIWALVVLSKPEVKATFR